MTETMPNEAISIKFTGARERAFPVFKQSTIRTVSVPHSLYDAADAWQSRMIGQEVSDEDEKREETVSAT